MTLGLALDNSYARLPQRFYTLQPPTPVAAPELVAFNDGLADELGLGALKSPDGVQILAGNAVPDGATPLAQVYAGHQFGGWVPQLGDGRALLLGEVVSGGRRVDVQLKGSGPTPYSRMGDGRAWLGPVLREYLVSEAMHALGIPTTRALAAVTTGEAILREGPRPGAVLTRVAASHIRVGTFQYFAARGDTEALDALAAHVIERHYPGARDAFDLLDAVVSAQSRLVAQWMGVGFIHGVMNTDNMSVAGQTIDYGPCAFMDDYHPLRVYSSIDHGGRYAYARQPDVAVWNLAQLATSLLPLMGPREAAIERATRIVNDFAPRFQSAYLDVFRAKLGLGEAREDDADLIAALLDAMARGGADFTLTFAGLSDGSARAGFADPEAFDDWAARWYLRRRDDPAPAPRNPRICPRNHLVEAVIAAAVDGDYALFEDLHAALSTPYDPHPAFAAPPAPHERVEATYCGT